MCNRLLVLGPDPGLTSLACQKRSCVASKLRLKITSLLYTLVCKDFYDLNSNSDATEKRNSVKSRNTQSYSY